VLSDSVKNKYTLVRRGRRGVNDKHKFYSDSQKIEAVTTYLILGSLPLVASALKINVNTLKLWKKSEWWKEIEQDLRIQEDLQLSKRMQGILSRSLDVVEDRLENGDFIYDQKTGELRRKPVALRDANKVLSDIGERRDVLINRHVHNESISTDKVEDTLKKLATEFARIAQTVNKGPVEVTDVLFGDDKDAKDETGRDA
jgi:hypothetical protein